MGLPPAALLLLYGGLALAPLTIAALSGPRENAFLAELGTGAGLMAYAMLLMQFISSGPLCLSGRWSGSGFHLPAAACTRYSAIASRSAGSGAK